VPGVNSQRGITLIESLAALMILSLAVLGLLAVQVRVLAQTQTSVRRGQAVRLIEDFAERIKSNPGGAAQLPRYVADWDTMPAAPADCRQRPCLPDDLAQWDLATWKRNLATALPLGKATVFAAPGGRQLGVVIGWRANEGAGGAAPGAVLNTDISQTGITCPEGLICHLAYVEP
jgi:type IV pilus assembly protein PilV